MMGESICQIWVKHESEDMNLYVDSNILTLQDPPSIVFVHQIPKQERILCQTTVIDQAEQ